MDEVNAANMSIPDMFYPKLIDSTNNVDIILNTDKFSVGRGIQNSYIIEDISISRTHCIFEKICGNWTITDRSSNGTLLNLVVLKRNDPTVLTHNDLITLSENYKFAFHNKPDDHEISEEDVLDLADALIAEIESARASGATTADRPAEATVTSPAAQPDSDVTDLTDKYLGSCTSDGGAGADTATACGPTFVEPMAVAGTSKVGDGTVKESESMDVACDVTKAKDKSDGDDTLDNAESEFQCSICTELFIKAVTLNCAHTFCSYCINEWRKKQEICPICRTKITTAFPTLVLDNFIEKVMEKASEDVKQKRKEVVKQREELEPKQKKQGHGHGRMNHQDLFSGIEISTDEDDESYEDLSDYSGSDWEDSYDNYDNYNGRPGVYYGGYGRCYACGDHGHWANGCPNR